MNLSLYWNTLKYLKAGQFLFRVLHNIYRPHVPSLTTPSIRIPDNIFSTFIKKRRSLITSTKFFFLNQEHDIINASDWNNPAIDKLWLYNLHYFDYLNAINDKGKNKTCLKIIKRWINENPAFAGNGWESYPLSLRIVNWIKYFLSGNNSTSEMTESLYLQAWYLRRRLEFHLKGNHLFANAKALIFAGLFFEGLEAEKWLAKGLNILRLEIDEQILEDGGHFERSPMYHAIILEDLLDLINISQVYGRNVSSDILGKWRNKASKMLSALTKQCHPDGEIAFFNDAALCIAAKPNEILDYAYNLGIKPDENIDNRIRYLSKTGYYTLSRDDWYLIVDAGPIGPDYVPGHSHADTLSFELSKANQRIFVNSGTSCYGVSQTRLRQRKTPAHNTLSVDGQDSSEVWSGFRVAKRVKKINRNLEIAPNKDLILAAHDGFKRFRSVGLHTRTWSLSDDGLDISDDIGGSGIHLIRVFFHVHPSVHVKLSGGRKIYIYNDKGNKIIEMEGDRRLEIFLQDGTYHPEFGLSISNQVIIGEIETQLPLNFLMRLVFI